MAKRKWNPEDREQFAKWAAEDKRFEQTVARYSEWLDEKRARRERHRRLLRRILLLR